VNSAKSASSIAGFAPIFCLDQLIFRKVRNFRGPALVGNLYVHVDDSSVPSIRVSYAAVDGARFFVFFERAAVFARVFFGSAGVRALPPSGGLSAASRAKRSARNLAVFSPTARRSAWYSAIAC
jgi:hypothetical protein